MKYTILTLTSDFPMKSHIPKFLFFLAFLFLFSSCLVPENKETYLSNFERFVKDVEKNGPEFKESDWRYANKRFSRYSVEWYEKFEDDLKMNEKIRVSVLKTRYLVAKANSPAGRNVGDHLGKELDKMGKEVREYLENDFDEDLGEITKGAREIGDSAVKVMEEVLKGFRKNKQ